MADNPQRDDWIERRLDGICWRVRSDYQERIFAAWRGGWRDAEVVRATADRRVLRAGGEPVLWVKHFRPRSLRGRVKALLRKSSAAREWQALEEARRRELPTPEPIAFGESGGIVKRESFLVTAELEGARPLADLLTGINRLSIRKRRKLIAEFGALVRKAHDRGLRQPDLHLENFLAREGASESKIFFIDLQRVSIGRSLGAGARWKNLSVLHGGCGAVTRADRLRFLRGYLSTPLSFPAEARRIAAVIERKGRRHRFHLWRSRERRCVAENREFAKVASGAFSGFARRDVPSAGLEARLARPEQMLDGPGIKIIKDSATTTIGVLSSAGKSFYVKRYNRQGLAYAFKNLFRASRGRRGWIVFNSLRIRGIPAPLPLAYLEKRRCRVLFESTVIAAAVPGENLADIAKRFREGKVSLRDKRALIDELARFIRRMHDRRVAHRDLKPQNIIAEQAGAARWRIGIVDADGIRLARVSARARDKNIARVARSFLGHPAVTRADCLRFLLGYLSAGDTMRWKKFWRRLARRASLRQGKPV
jgi:tRNA A-37 threonylcarbamoyl transferase component Bud32